MVPNLGYAYPPGVCDKCQGVSQNVINLSVAVRFLMNASFFCYGAPEQKKVGNRWLNQFALSRREIHYEFHSLSSRFNFAQMINFFQSIRDIDRSHLISIEMKHLYYRLTYIFWSMVVIHAGDNPIIFFTELTPGFDPIKQKTLKN